jgi:endo-1,4-beta-xylanase
MRWTPVLCLCLMLVFGIARGQNTIGLRAASSIRGLPFGSAASIENLRNNADNGQFLSIVKSNYQIIEPENDLKPQKLWRGENNYDWTDSDWLLGATPSTTGWAQQNSIQIRGHTLLWANDAWTPGWLLARESSISSEKAYSMLRDYIHTVVGRYRGKIPWWDVVNEAIDDTENNGRPYDMRNFFWYRKLGQDFIKYAFIFAHEADPQAQLYYNDYNTEGTSSKANNAFALLKWAKSQGAPIHGVGMQWHIGLWAMPTPGDQYYQNAQRLIDSGFDIMVTELDVAVGMNNGQMNDYNDVGKQAAVYRAVLKYALNFSPKLRAFITWGFTDKYSWIPNLSGYKEGAALPYDWNHQPKLAYWYMLDELTRVIPDGTYRIALRSNQNQCLDTQSAGQTGSIRTAACANTDNQKWNVNILGDGTYRLSPRSNQNHALDAFNENAAQGGVQAYNWWSGPNQNWVLGPLGNNAFRLGPSKVWWRALGGGTPSIQDNRGGNDQQWVFTRV